MNEVKAAILTRLQTDATLIAAPLLNGTNVFYRQPEQKVEISDTAAAITFWFFDRDPDWAVDEYGKIGIRMQLDIWATDPDKCDSILTEVDRLLYDWRFTTTTWASKRLLRRGGRELPRDEAGIHGLSTDWLITVHKIGG